MRDDGGYCLCRLQKHRRFNGQPLRASRRHPYWAAGGWLPGGLKVWVVRHGATDYATNRLTLPAAEGRRRYRVRAQIEVCQTQPVNMTEYPLRRAPWAISDLRGTLKREHVVDIHLFCCHDHFTDQTVSDSLTLFERQPV